MVVYFRSVGRVAGYRRGGRREGIRKRRKRKERIKAGGED